MTTTTAAADQPPGTSPHDPTSTAVNGSGTVVRNARTVGMVWRREMIRLRRTPTRIVTGIAQPLLFLFVMGAGLSRLIETDIAGDIDYQQFLFPGILSMSVITSSLFSSISVVWDREFGFLREMLVAPVSRTTIVLGKALGGGSVAAVQGLILVVTAPLVGVSLTPGRAIGLVLALLLLAFAMTAFGMVLATRMDRMESFQMVMTLVLQPMIFLSGTVFPLNDLPGWLNFLTRLNPATYGVDLVRRVALEDAPGVTLNGSVVPLWADALVVFVLGVALFALAVKLFDRSD
jgi:ABC-2 type transport system permease protein